MVGLFWLASLLTILLVQSAMAQVPIVLQGELQIAIRRYMQCQADNVGMYNVQAQLSQNRLDQVQAELDETKKELAKLKAEKKNE